MDSLNILVKMAKPKYKTSPFCFIPSREYASHTLDSVIEILTKCLLGWLMLMLPALIGQVEAQNCPSFPPANIYLVLCGDPLSQQSPRCIQEKWLCDGYSDCAQGQDESPATCAGGDPCDNNLCCNGATCISFSRQQQKSVAYYLCKCIPGFIGQYCEVADGTIDIVVTQMTLMQNDEAVITLSNANVTRNDSDINYVTQFPYPPFLNETLTFEPQRTVVSLAISTNTQEFHVITKRDAVPTNTPDTNATILPRAAAPLPDLAACSPNPCLNGVCTPLWSGFHCNCRPGYAGPKCQQGVNACASKPCLNGGSCFRSGQTFQCSCRRGYTGRQCEIEINECASNPCQNGASCDNEVNRYSCQCKAGFTGVLCEQNINECASGPCFAAQGGRCIDGVDGFTCQCPINRAGQFCERPQQCPQDPCLNHGICNLSPVVGGQPTCFCLQGFTGRFCETNLNDCLTNPCVQGRCFDGDNKFTCVCNEGFTGPKCDTSIDPCEPNPCKSSGYCCRSGKTWCARQLPVWYHECYCPNGFTGTSCERQLDPCYSSPCLNNGMCGPEGQGFVCTCPINFSGSRCEQQVPCNSAPCMFGGTCLSLPGGQFQCQCDSKHFGQYCQSVFPCLSRPCQNGATCINRDSGYTCTCLPNYNGLNCENYLPCITSPCRNGAQCVAGVGGAVSCVCTANFTGQFCERYLPCTGQPCLNGGQCVDNQGTYRCNCPFNYTGQNCEAFIPCASFPCQSGGSCLTVGNQYVCNCAAGYTGQNCEVYVPCSSSPCANGGSCDNIGNGRFTCTCPSTHTGPRCETSVPCAQNPCLNNGICIPEGLGFRCQCTPAYSGSRCEVYRSCRSAPCLNGGSCFDTTNSQFQCVCPPDFTGQVCETSKPCFPNPCLNNGRCTVNANNQIHCSCVAPFIGPRCEQRDNCFAQPCQNQGYCIRLDGNSYRCICPAAYTGSLCEIYLSCSSTPCLNNAVCIEDGSTYRCNCTTLYGGTNCQTYLPCGSHPCQNGADCIDRGQSYQCVCPRNYVGINCERPLPCASNPCLGGTCNNIGDSYVCQCDYRYTGRNCDVPVICDQTTCINGICRLINQVGTCVCNPGFTGVKCESRISPCSSNPCATSCTCVTTTTGYRCDCSFTTPRPTTTPAPTCDSNPCFNGGRCIKTAGGFICQCNAPFTGSLCEKREGICDNKPCANGARCIPDGIAYTCLCQPPWTGDLCQREVLTCDEAPCKNGGTCFTDSLGVYCRCPGEWEGLFCQLRKGICDPNPCQNNGVCWQISGKLGCDCPRGFEGNYCEKSVVGCNPNPCNEGNCLENSQGKFLCSCPPEWTGDQCQIRNPCYSQPCRNGGTCAAKETGFQCFCLPGYSGLTCQGQLPACNSVPCFNGATCLENPTSTGFICRCLPGYTGSQCEVNINECSIGGPRCANGGTCVDLINAFRCDCPAGYSGTTCTVRDNCLSQPCGTTGTCINTPNVVFNLDYTCRCLPNYQGPNCRQFNYCSSSPCLNSGSCTNQLNGFRCACVENYSGLRCEQQIQGCNGVTCNNRGTCIPQGLLGYTCNCAGGFVGKDCESSTCNARPCANGGVCKVGGTRGYVCQCPASFGGEQCHLRLSDMWPRFSGNSYLKLPGLNGLATRTAIEIQFFPVNGEGLIMYYGHSDTVNGDFMALGLTQNKPVFRLNLGAGVLTLTGPELALNKWHTITITRIELRTWMTVNTFSVFGVAPQGSIGLTLDMIIWLGGVNDPSIINQRAVFQRGFQGCVHAFKIGQTHAALLLLSRGLESQDLSQCSADPCTTHRCTNGGQCLYETDTSYTCLCAVGFMGRDCSARILRPAIPLFEKSGYLAYTLPLAHFSGQTFIISLDFRPSFPNGTVLYAADANDFFALSLYNGNVRFSFDFGSGSATLTSMSKVTLGAWHTVTITRSGQRVQMVFRLDGAVVENAQGVNTGLDVGENLYIGGVPHTVEVRNEVLDFSGFSGCLRNIVIQQNRIDLSQLGNGFGVTDCIVPPCEDNQCSTGSTCRPVASSVRGYECICPAGRTGTFCEATECSTGSECRNGGRCVRNIQGVPQCQCTHLWTGPTCNDALRFTIASFAGNGYLAYPNNKFIGFEFTEFEIVFRTTMTNGLVLWMGNASSEFLALGIRNGFVQVSVNIAGVPGQVGQVTLNLQNVSNNQWVTVKVEMSKQFIFVQVTNNEGLTSSQYGDVPGEDTQFNIGDMLIYLGGLPGDIDVDTNKLFTSGLNGCVLQLRAAKIVRQLQEIHLQEDAINGTHVTSCIIT